MSKKLDTQAIGLDGGLHFIKWLTGAENLHYGLWRDIDVSAGNLRAAQDAYSDFLFSFMPKRKLRILDIGGGAGETAKKLLALGHDVQIVVPSALFADRCRANAPKAVVHECKFEDFLTSESFDLCLFSESFQYIHLQKGLSHALSLLDEGGEILIADCFRSHAYRNVPGGVVGGGHKIGLFEAELARLPLLVLDQCDITEDVAPSIDLEQGLFNVLGHAIGRIDSELQAKRPASRWLVQRAIAVFLNKRRRVRLAQRFMEQTRNSRVFKENNVYQILRLGRA